MALDSFLQRDLNRKGDLNPEIYSDRQIDDFQIKVAHDIYMNKAYLDTIFDRVIHSKMRKDKGYKYSDLGYYILKELLKIKESCLFKRYGSRSHI